MAAPQGYQCEFIDQVVDDFYCTKCTLVARRIAITSCCAESFCQTCIAGVTDQCPACGEKDFSTLQHAKYQKRIGNLRVYCTMKERGCGWSGTLDQLDTHLDPDQNNCQYVDTKCPLRCKQVIPKNKVEQHMAEECVKRGYICKYCSFKASYEEVVDKHLPECVYVPLDCPNMCGVTFERDFMEDHMKTCRLEEVECEFGNVGCKVRFRREDQEEHTRQNTHQHLTLTALLAVGTKKDLQQKILEKDKKVLEQDQKIFEQDKKIEELRKKLEDKNRELQHMTMTLKEKLDEQTQTLEQKFDLKLSKLKELFDCIKTKSDDNEKKHANISKMLTNSYFEMKNFSKEKAKSTTCEWKSPPMYTHPCGYKICINVDANGCGCGKGKAINVRVFVMPGEYDGYLKWPVVAKFTVELINQTGGRNASGTSEVAWSKPSSAGWVCHIYGDGCKIGFIEHSRLRYFLFHDTLYFLVSSVEFL